ncbi:MAG: alcohol dehydrogenase catalytic domain-containing protein [Candidatus Aenigmarchaeota archaeon]|nr:alcohol dehydrogenase catalytic domain-containing protein [Candidatus Aenigmarchaeota archaeon]
MRAAVYHRNADVRIEDVPRPSPREGEVLLKVLASGICGSDVMEWYRIQKAPLVLGHEVAGVVEESRDPRFSPGERAVATHHIPCNACKYCHAGHHSACATLHSTSFHPGGFAEFVLLPQLNVDRGTFLLPEGLTYDEGTFVEPLACALRGQRLAGLRPGQSVLVLGSGVAGLLHILLARALGAGEITATDISPYRLAAAKRAGADKVQDAREPLQPHDLVIVCTGALPAAQQALTAVEKGGTILFFAVPRPEDRLPLPLNDLWKNEVRLLTSYAGPPADMRAALDLLRSRRLQVRDLVTHRLPLGQAQEGFRLVASAQDSLKVLLYPHGAQ